MSRYRGQSGSSTGLSYGLGGSEQYSELDDGSISRYKAVNPYYDIYEYKPNYPEGHIYSKPPQVSPLRVFPFSFH